MPKNFYLGIISKINKVEYDFKWAKSKYYKNSMES